LPRIAGLGVLALGLLLVALPVFAQEGDEDIRKEIEALKQGQQNIQKQLQEIKKLLQQQRPAAPQGPKVKDVVFNLGNNDVLGDAGAALTLIEFTDYQ